MKNVEINKNIKLSEHLASPSEAALSHLSELNGVHLSPHFTLGELTVTNVKTADGNIPSHVAIENLKRVCKWLEELRYSYNTLYCLKPGEDYETSENVEGIIINSGYRSPAVNKLAGGVATSNHLTGCAVDIRVAGKEQLIRYACILIDIADDTDQDFDELLLEHGSNCVIWLHFAVRPPGQHNRRKINFLRG
ncbi:MAG: hypothetical protein E7103_11230 [Prevotella sp.]|jgi:hypothetical protein|nr:hypothetical protein [Prevotella sp.]